AEPRFLLTQVDGRKRDHAAYGRYLLDTYGDHVMRAIIRTSASLAETTHDGRTVFDHDVTSRGALDYANAADELIRLYFPGSAAPMPSEPSASQPEPEAPPEVPAPRPWESLHRVS